MSEKTDPVPYDTKLYFPTGPTVGAAIDVLGKAGYTVFPTNRVENLDLWVETSTLLDEALRPEVQEARAQYIVRTLAYYAIDAVKARIIYVTRPATGAAAAEGVNRHIARISIVVATKEELEAEQRERVRFDAAQQRNARRERGWE